MKLIKCQTGDGHSMKWKPACENYDDAGRLVSYNGRLCIQTLIVSRKDARDLGHALLESVGVSVPKQSAPKPDPAFWIVWCPTASPSPKHRHATYEAARAEAERLAKQRPGWCYYPLPVGEFAQAQSTVAWAHESSDIPF